MFPESVGKIFDIYKTLPYAPTLTNYLPPDTMCDPEILDAMDARGYLEAQREVAMNQNLIAKPDSVLEYSCYDQLMNDFSSPFNLPPLFSNFGCVSCLWVDPGRLANLQLDIIRTISLAMYSYIGVNHFHTTFLSSIPPLKGGFIGTRSDETFMAGIPTLPYSCDYMGKIWEDAKCRNFLDEEDHDGFYDFPWYSNSIGGTGGLSYGKDPRTFLLSGGWFAPNYCISPMLDVPYVGDLQAAYNYKEDMYVLKDENPLKGPSSSGGAPYKEDPVASTLSNLVAPAGVYGGTAAVPCSAPIPTGICVQRGGLPKYPDAVCPNPGCYYDPAVSGAGSCNVPASGLPASWCKQ